jgi:hypothetical protein
MGPLLPAARAALLCALVGCSSLPELDWNPLLRVEHRPGGAVEVEAFGPLVDVRHGPEGLSHAVRPFYQHKADGDGSVTDFLAPLGRVFSTGSGTKFRFWPLVWAGEMDDTPGREHWAGVFFPFVLAGDGQYVDDGYFAFFPVAGRTRDVFGIDQFDFFLWPLFMRTRMDVTEPSTSWTVLLVGGWTEGGPRDGSWRLLPLYRHRLVRDPEGTLRTDQHTVLWPFFTFGDDHLDTDDASTRWAFWPLASYESADTWFRSTFLWPFFRFNRGEAPELEGGVEFLYDFPWPFLRWQRSAEASTERVWPFYSHKATPEVDSTSFVWPLGWWREFGGLVTEAGAEEAVPYRRRDLYFIPFVHDSWRRLDGREGEDTEFQLWPLWHADHGARGRRDLGTLSLVPARNIPFLKPADELYSCFWTVWRHQSDGVRDETRLFFDTTFWRTGTEGTRVSVPFVYSRRPLAQGGSRHQTLWGLFGADTDGEGLRSLAVLGFDLWSR